MGLPKAPPRWALTPVEWRNELQVQVDDVVVVVDSGTDPLLRDVAALVEHDLPFSTGWIDAPWETGYHTFVVNDVQLPGFDSNHAPWDDDLVELIDAFAAAARLKMSLWPMYEVGLALASDTLLPATAPGRDGPSDDRTVVVSPVPASETTAGGLVFTQTPDGDGGTLITVTRSIGGRLTLKVAGVFTDVVGSGVGDVAVEGDSTVVTIADGVDAPVTVD
jgi:hypothetical protein